MDSKFNVVVEDGSLKINLSGQLDAANAPALLEELKRFAGEPIKNIVFLAHDLEYMSSAGLRVIVFAKQKLSIDVQVYLIGAKESIVNVVKMSGLDNFMYIQDKF